MKTQSSEYERIEEQQVRNIERLGAYYIRYGRYLRQRIEYLRRNANARMFLRPQAD